MVQYSYLFVHLYSTYSLGLLRHVSQHSVLFDGPSWDMKTENRHSRSEERATPATNPPTHDVHFTAITSHQDPFEAKVNERRLLTMTKIVTISSNSTKWGAMSCRNFLRIVMATVLVGNYLGLVRGAEGQQQPTEPEPTTSYRNYTYSSLPKCTLSTYELSQLGPTDALEPCVVHEVRPYQWVPSTSTAGGNGDEDFSSGGRNNGNDESYSVIPVVQVTPSSCQNHRDGTVTGVEMINSDSNSKGIPIGFQKNHVSGSPVIPFHRCVGRWLRLWIFD